MNWAALYAILSKKIDDISALQMKKVTELPETGETNTLYLVPKTTAEEGNYSDEYIWDADLEKFEKVGDTLINDSPLVIFLCEYKSNAYFLKDGFSGADVVNAVINGKYVIIINPTRDYQIFFFLKYKNNWAHFIYFADQSSMSEGNITFYRIYNTDNPSSSYFTPYDYSFLMDAPSKAEENKILKANSNKGAAWADMPNIATAYSSSSTYDLGDLCLYHNLLYECTTAITVAEAWTVAHWTQVNISDELDKKANLTDIPTDYTKDTATAPLYDSTATYAVGDICMYQKELYKCNTAIDPAEEWDSTHWTKTDILSEMPTPVPAVTDYAKDSSVAPLYDSTATYALGDLVMHDKELYKCTTAISTAEAWDSTHWTKTDMVDELPSGMEEKVVYYISNWTLQNGKTMQDILNDYDSGKKVVLKGTPFDSTRDFGEMPLHHVSETSPYRGIVFVILNPVSYATEYVAISDQFQLGIAYFNSNPVNATAFKHKVISYYKYPSPFQTTEGMIIMKGSGNNGWTVSNDYTKLAYLTAKYSTSKTYNKNDIVTKVDTNYAGIYKCKEDNVTGSWNSSKWDAITVLDAIDLKISDAITSVLNTSF